MDKWGQDQSIHAIHTQIVCQVWFEAAISLLTPGKALMVKTLLKKFCIFIKKKLPVVWDIWGFFCERQSVAQSFEKKYPQTHSSPINQSMQEQAPPSIWRSTPEATFFGTFYISSYLKLGQERSNPFKIGARTTTHHCQHAHLVCNVVMAHIPSGTCAERVWVDKSKFIPFSFPPC